MYRMHKRWLKGCKNVIFTKNSIANRPSPQSLHHSEQLSEEFQKQEEPPKVVEQLLSWLAFPASPLYLPSLLLQPEKKMKLKHTLPSTETKLGIIGGGAGWGNGAYGFTNKPLHLAPKQCLPQHHWASPLNGKNQRYKVFFPCQVPEGKKGGRKEIRQA